MKTTIELPDASFREAKALAAKRGITLKDLFSKALEEKLEKERSVSYSQPSSPPWMESFGALSHLKEESVKINTLIEEEFEQLEPEDLS